jgi:hypothetical protein
MCLKIQTHIWYWVVNHVFHVVLITDHNPKEVVCTFRFVYIVEISSKQIVNKCGIIIVKEYGMYMIVISMFTLACTYLVIKIISK